MSRSHAFTGTALVGLIAASAAFHPLAATEETAPSCLEAVCKVTSGKITGSGVVYREDSDHYYILTARHLVQPVENSPAQSTTLRFFHAGWVSQSIPGNVEFTSESADDVAVVGIHKKHFSMYRAPAIIALMPYDVNEGQRVIAIGITHANDSTAWPISMIGRVTEVPSRSTICFLPSIDRPRPGGALITDDGKQLIGICTVSVSQPVENRAVTGSRILELLPENLK